MGWLIGKRRRRGGCASGRSTSKRSIWRGMRRVSTVLALVIVALASAAYLSTATRSLIPVAQASSPRLTIIVPHPSDKNTDGPVGTNITVRGDGLAANTAYSLGYASVDVSGCATGFQPFQNITETTGADGTFMTTITWPSAVANVGTTYYICAQSATLLSDPLAMSAQSVETFHVDAATPPAIDVATAGATMGDGTPGASPLPDGSFYRGGAVTITGHNFFPAGSTLLVAVSSKQLQQPAEFQAAAQKQLTTSTGEHTITSQPGGDFSATVSLPSSLKAGAYYLYVFSNDGADQAIPSLVASKQITLVLAPTPQPTATTAPTATATGGAQQGTGGPPGPKFLGGVLVLAGLSIVLFIAGVISLLSAAAMPRPGRP